MRGREGVEQDDTGDQLLISITKVKSDGWLGDKNIIRMEFTQNVLLIRGGYVHKNNFVHVGGSEILVETSWR